jgi:hypothetical protein
MASARLVTSTVTSSLVDSRQYVFAYSIRSLADLPHDFPVPQADRDFRIGIFLPRDPPDWFGRSAYPPRIVLLSRDAINVFAHPKSGEAPVRIPLSDLAYYETGHFLLIGWLRMVAGQTEINLPYNTRSQRAVDDFLCELERKYLPARIETAEVRKSKTTVFGPSLDIKFANTLTMILDIGERVQVCFFNPPFERWCKSWLFRVRTCDAGDLIALTGRRIVWVTDRRNERHDRYGTITRVAPACAVTGAGCERTGNDLDLTIHFSSGVTWSVPLPSEQYEVARRFAEHIYA